MIRHVLSVVLVQFLTFVSIEAARSVSFTSSRNPTPFVTRGGGKRATTVATDTEYTAVGVIPSEVLDTATILSLPSALQQAFQQQQAETCSLVMFHDKNPTSSSVLERNVEMLETLSMTCHVLVVFLSNNELELQPEVIKAILEGARRRRKLAGHDKLKLILVLAGSSSATDETRVALALKELQDFAPQDLDAFEMTTVQQLPTIWEEMIQHGHDDTSELIDEEGLAKLIETIYESLSHKKCSVNLTKWKQHPRKLHHASQQAIVVDQVMTHVQPLLQQLETKQQAVWLNPEETVPMLEFGQEANGILETARSIIDASQPPLSTEERQEILLGVASQVKILYDQQLASLREHYGRRYEAVLDNEDKEQWTMEAQQVTQAFRAAGLQAIPQLCQEGHELADADFSYVVELQGLIADMMEATSTREEIEGYIEDEEDESTEPRVAKWYEKLAARAVVLGINYLQGYMAWQAIQRAAAERDRAVPKFPLF